jgi:hypothetical protein
MRALDGYSRSSLNDGFGADSGPSRGVPCRPALRPTTTIHECDLQCLLYVDCVEEPCLQASARSVSCSGHRGKAAASVPHVTKIGAGSGMSSRELTADDGPMTPSPRRCPRAQRSGSLSAIGPMLHRSSGGGRRPHQRHAQTQREPQGRHPQARQTGGGAEESMRLPPKMTLRSPRRSGWRASGSASVRPEEPL